MVQLIPLPPNHLLLHYNPDLTGLTFLVPAYPGYSGTEPICLSLFVKGNPLGTTCSFPRQVSPSQHQVIIPTKNVLNRVSLLQILYWGILHKYR